MPRPFPVLFLAVAVILCEQPGFSGPLILTKADDAIRVCRSFISPTSRLARQALKHDEIAELAAICKNPGGLSEVGRILGRRNLPNSILEDTYLRIAVVSRRLEADDAADLFKHLAGTPGFRTTLRKVNSPSAQQAAGHLTEIRIAHAAKTRGGKVIELGKRFDDGLKRGPSDIDLLFEFRNQKFAAEIKDWRNPVPLDMVAGDAETLLAYCRANPGTKPVFLFTSKPTEAAIKLLRSKGVTPLHGSPSEIMSKLSAL